VADKTTRAKLKRPDALQKAGADAGDWIGEHGGLVAIGILVLLVAGAIFGVASYFSDRKAERARKAFGEALQPVERQVEPEGQSAAQPGEPTFKSERERDEAIVKSLQEFRSNYEGQLAALTASLPLAAAHFRLGKTDEALALFQSYAKERPQEEPLRALALEGIGYGHEAKSQWVEAQNAFSRMQQENKSEFMAGMGLFHQGRLLALQDKKQEAADVFSQVTEAHANTAAAKMAADRLAILKEQGIKPTPKPAAPPPAAPDAAAPVSPGPASSTPAAPAPSSPSAPPADAGAGK
jgi:tetratricopeptide (TPR) repeat protein